MFKHAVVVFALFSVACATPAEKPAAPAPPPTATSTSAEMEAHVMTETKQTAAAELQ